MSREAILSNVRNALEQNKLNNANRDYKDLIKHSSNNIVQEYITMQTANKGIVVESKDILNDIKEILTKLESKKILYTLDMADIAKDLESTKEFDIKPYDKSVDSIRDELFNTDTSIIRAKCGVADLGIFGVVSSSLHPRLASLITKNCIIILDKKDIVQSLNDGINKLKGNDKLPSNIIFIAGPSRTADIELKTVFGVHGPQQTYIILI